MSVDFKMIKINFTAGAMLAEPIPFHNKAVCRLNCNGVPVASAGLSAQH